MFAGLPCQAFPPLLLAPRGSVPQILQACPDIPALTPEAPCSMAYLSLLFLEVHHKSPEPPCSLHTQSHNGQALIHIMQNCAKFVHLRLIYLMLYLSILVNEGKKLHRLTSSRTILLRITPRQLVVANKQFRPESVKSIIVV